MSQLSNAVSIDTAVRPVSNRFTEMSSDEFVKIIFTELTNQDPLQPNDTSALLEQLNSIRSIESDLELTRQLKTLVTQNQLAAASNMIGKLVSGKTENLSNVNGRVVAAVKRGDEIGLQLESGFEIPMGNVESVVELPPAQVGPATAAGGPLPPL